MIFVAAVLAAAVVLGLATGSRWAPALAAVFWAAWLAVVRVGWVGPPTEERWPAATHALVALVLALASAAAAAVGVAARRRLTSDGRPLRSRRGPDDGVP